VEYIACEVIHLLIYQLRTSPGIMAVSTDKRRVRCDAKRSCCLATPQTISDPYCQTPCLWLSVRGQTVRSTAWANRQRPRYAAKLAASRATSPTGLYLFSKNDAGF